MHKKIRRLLGIRGEVQAHEDPYESPRNSEKVKPLRSNSYCSPIYIFYAIVVLFLSIAVPLTIYVTLYTNNPEPRSEPWTCALRISYRVPCMKDVTGITKSICENVNCCWNTTDKVCYQSIPSRHSYSVRDWKDTGTSANQLQTTYLELMPRLAKSPYGRQQHETLKTLVVPYSENHLRMLIYNTNHGEPALPERTNLDTTNFRIDVYGPEYYSVKIYRRNDSSLLLSTAMGPMIATENYWELAIQFPSNGAVFGLGELLLSSKTKVLYNNADQLGSNPFVIILDYKGNAHGIVFNNTGPMEFEILESSNLLIVRSLSTLMWDLSIFAGPTPADVMEQYTAMEGRRPFLPPPWALGLHVCRDTDFQNVTAALEEVQEFVTQTEELGIPYESDCFQERLLDGFTLTVPNEMAPVFDFYKENNLKLMISLMPQVDPSLATKKELFVLDESGDAALEDLYQGRSVCFPDFFRNDTETWLKDKLTNLSTSIGGTLAGFVLRDNWPAVNLTEGEREEMDYVPGGSLSNGTLWWLVKHENTSHYLLHNEYGLQHARHVASSLQADQLVLNSATYTGSGALGGSHVHARAEVECTWSNMKSALSVALGLGLVGIPLSGGGPICGSVGDFDDELCRRWYLMSSMLPLMHVSSAPPLRDPTNLPSGFSKDTVRRALQLRYELLPYFHSLFHAASVTGVPVARPLFFEFPTDNHTWTIDEQFMVGEALLVRPAFMMNLVTVPVYLPKENTTWYHFRGGHKVNNGTGGQEVSIPIAGTEQVVLLRGGFIVATQEALSTVSATLDSGVYNLVVGLKCVNNSTCSASGDLWVSSSLNFTFASTETGLEFHSSCDNLGTPPSLDSVTVYGLDVTTENQVSVTVDSCNAGTQPNVTIIDEDEVLRIASLNLTVCCTETILINWNIER